MDSTTSRMITLAQQDLALLYEVSTSIHTIADMDAMLQRILSKIKAVFGIEGASIALHDEQRGEFYFIRTVEEQNESVNGAMEGMRFPNHFGVAGWVHRHNEAVIVNDAGNDDRFSNLFNFQKRVKTRSMICVPLRSRKGLIGVLYAINKSGGDFTLKDCYLLEIVASPIAIALENARLYGEIKQHVDTLERENLRLQSEVRERFNLQGVIGAGPEMAKVFALLDKVMDTRTPILLQGETGTGKELLAKTIHYNGPLRDHPFIAENCGALTENLLESELFGHVKGAFTGAFTDKKGIFELADRGTVFLDEIMDMSSAMQNKILRVLEERQIRRVGGSHTIDVDFRLITSCNRDLYKEVQKGRFREDLFYRIQVFPIVLPPLRERKEDIPLLAAHFITKSAQRLNRPVPRITPGALNLLTGYAWPGNIRELKNEIERAVILAGNAEEIETQYLSDRIATGNDGHKVSIAGAKTLSEATERLERQMVAKALKQTNGNRSRAAVKLGLTRQGLLNKIRRYTIEA